MIVLLFFLFLFFLVGNVALNLLKERLRNVDIDEIKKTHLFYLPFHLRCFSNDTSLFVLSCAVSLTTTLSTIGAALSSFLFLAFLPLTLPFLILIAWCFLIIFLFFSDLLPTLIEKERALGSLPLASFYLFLFSPLTLPLLFLKNKISKGQKREDLLDEMRENILAILKSSNIISKLDPTDKRLLESAIKFKDLIVKEVMVPRVQLFSLDAGMPIREAAHLLAREGYSRTPVFRDSLDNIIGLLLYKDILSIYMECEEGKKDKSLLDRPIETIMKGVFYTPETKKVSHLLQEFRSKQKHMAIVVDEYGGTEGVVTIEDILEEIVGQIADEYDVNEEILYLPDPEREGWIVNARMNIKDAEDIFAIDIPKEGDYDTIGGFIFYKEGTIPPKGTLIETEGFTLEIVSTSERAVEKVRLSIKKNEENLS